MKRNKILRKICLMLTMVMATFVFSGKASAQKKPGYTRIARIVVDSAKLGSYQAALKEEIEMAVQKEPGVLSLNAVYEKNNPTHVIVFEIYADKDAYQLHIQTAHFKKYKSMAAGMVKSLVLVDVVPIASATKLKQ